MKQLVAHLPALIQRVSIAVGRLTLVVIVDASSRLTRVRWLAALILKISPLSR
jgi:hypothetical protein